MKIRIYSFKKFSKILFPTGVRNDSGWNWTPNTGFSLCFIAIISPSFVQADFWKFCGVVFKDNEWYRAPWNGEGIFLNSPDWSWWIKEVFPWRICLDGIIFDPKICRSGSWRNNYFIGIEFANILACNRIICFNDYKFTKHFNGLHQIPGKWIVIIHEENHVRT